MMDYADHHTIAPGGTAYASLLPRFQAFIVDLVIYVLASAILLAVGVRLEEAVEAGGPVIGVWIAFLLLYEPLTVSLTGGTIGHHSRNIMVVHERSGGRLGFWRAFLRALVKGTVGLLSFVFMAVTRRHQALHDLASSSTVRIKDPALARPYYVVSERLEDPGVVLPSRWRRVLAIVGYGIAGLVVAFTPPLFLTSVECVDYDRCTPAEDLVWTLAGFVWLGLTAAAIIGGWRGKLPGCRARRV